MRARLKKKAGVEGGAVPLGGGLGIAVVEEGIVSRSS